MVVDFFWHGTLKKNDTKRGEPELSLQSKGGSVRGSLSGVEKRQPATNNIFRLQY